MTGSPAVAQLHLSWIYPGDVHTRSYSAGKLSSESSLRTTLAGHDKIRQVSVSVDYQHRRGAATDASGSANCADRGHAEAECRGSGCASGPAATPGARAAFSVIREWRIPVVRRRALPAGQRDRYRP